MPDPKKRRRIAKNESLELIKFGIRIDAICDYCGGPAGWDTFITRQNMIEYNLTGYCQACQDESGVINPGKVPPGLRRRDTVKSVAGFKSGGKGG